MGNAIDPIGTRVPFLDPRTNMVSREWFGFFSQTRRSTNDVASSTVLTVGDQAGSFPNSQALTPVTGEITAATVGNEYRIGLADTAVMPGDYGDASHLVKITLDAKGRATAAEVFELDSDNVTEGATNLFFTVARARAVLSGGTGIDYTAGTGDIALADTAVVPGSYGDASHASTYTVDQQGRLTAAGEDLITIAAVIGASPIADGVHACGTGFITTKDGVIMAIT